MPPDAGILLADLLDPLSPRNRGHALPPSSRGCPHGATLDMEGPSRGLKAVGVEGYIARCGSRASHLYTHPSGTCTCELCTHLSIDACLSISALVSTPHSLDSQWGQVALIVIP